MALTQEQDNEANTLYTEACKTMEGLIILDGYRPKDITEGEQIRAEKAIELFRKVLNFVPDHFPSLFFIGKIFQRLRDYEKALIAFEAALQYEHENFNLPQEASLVAMHLNLIEKAIAYSEESVKRNPTNVALIGNHAMNLLLSENDDEAERTINRAIELDSSDSVNNNIKNLILDVVAGKRKRPTFKELMG